MRKTLYLKFVLGYLIFGFFGFLVVATFVSSMTLEHLKREKADSLYKEATLIANTYASDLYSSNVSDVYVYRAGVANVFIAPDLIQKLFSGKNMIG